MTTRKICPCTGCPTHQGSCPNITNRGRCARCKPDRGTTTQQGLGWAHQQQRRTLIAAAIGTWCPDCPPERPTLMTDPAQMVADHSTPRSQDPNSQADRVHCRPCSNKQGGQIAHRVGTTSV